MSEQQKQQFNQKLWDIANKLRGKMDASDFKNYMLGFIFYKYLSEKIETFANEILAPENLTFIDIQPKMPQYNDYIDAIKHATIDKLGFFLQPDDIFRQVLRKGKNYNDQNNADENHENHLTIIEDLTRVFRNIEASTMGKSSEEDFDKLFNDVDLSSPKIGKSVADKNELITKILFELKDIDFKLDNANTDILGDAYEYLIGEFASSAGKKAGEFYTPKNVSKILAKIVTLSKKQLKSVYDPTCGSGSLLLRVAKEAEVSDFYGQEMNNTTYNLARMNMIMHDIHYSRFDIKQEDTLKKPQHTELVFEAIVANPPFSAEWDADVIQQGDERFSQYGRLAPKNKADFAFVQHMLHYLDEKGVMACVLPHGVLFRGGAEYDIRKFLVERKNYIDAIIGLPANIFYGTSIPTCILVCKKCRESPNDILFVDASQYFEKKKNQNELHDDDVMRIIDAYTNRQNIAQFSKVVSLEEIQDNDYNLNIPRYVDAFAQEDNVNIYKITAQMQELEKEIFVTNTEINVFCKNMDIPLPF